MIYRATHRTTYEYSAQASTSHNLVHLRPRDHATQTCRRHELSVNPAFSIRQTV